MPDSGNAAQTRLIVEQVAEVVGEQVITRFVAQHPELRQAAVVSEIPAPLKWAGVIVAGLFTLGTGSMVLWLVSSMSQMQITVARIDERLNSGTIKDARFDDLERRVATNERKLQEMGK